MGEHFKAQAACPVTHQVCRKRSFGKGSLLCPADSELQMTTSDARQQDGTGVIIMQEHWLGSMTVCHMHRTLMPFMFNVHSDTTHSRGSR